MQRRVCHTSLFECEVSRSRATVRPQLAPRAARRACKAARRFSAHRPGQQHGGRGHDADGAEGDDEVLPDDGAGFQAQLAGGEEFFDLVLHEDDFTDRTRLREEILEIGFGGAEGEISHV